MLDTVKEESVQSRATDDSEYNSGLFHVMVQANEIVPPWWSRSRDMALRNFWKKSDQLSGAMFSFVSKITSIPFKITARNTVIKSHVKKAEQWEEKLEYISDLGNGWMQFLSKWIEDFVGTDNGAFAEIIGPGDVNGPITGEVTGIANLDSIRCTRTNNPEYPVIYQDPKTGRHRLHASRVMFASQMPSADETMNAVGVCAISRALYTAQNMIDMNIYNQEKLGSRPNRGVVLVGGGLDPEYVANSLQIAYNAADSAGLRRFRPMTIIGNSTVEAPTLDIKETNSVPDGFDYKTSLELGMAIVALAFGVDVRELFPASSTGATRADALLQHIKQRGKGPGYAISVLEHLLNIKVLPPMLKFEFDYQDDAQDRQEAEISRIRATTRKSDIETGVTTVRVARQTMVEDGELTDEQFAELELEDGRLVDGASVLSLFGSDDKFFVVWLQLEGVVNPLNIVENDKQTVLDAIEKRRSELYQLLTMENAVSVIKAKQALSALNQLQQLYGTIQEAQPEETIEEEELPQDVLTMQDEEEAAMQEDLNDD